MKAAGVLLFSILIAVSSVAAEESKPPFKIDGRISLQLESRDRFSRSDFAKEAQIDLETKRKEGIRGEMDLKIGTGSSIVLRELFLDYKSVAANRLILGQAKKRFGLEGEMDLEERLTLGDSLVYRKLSSLAYVGRDSTFEYRRGDLTEHRMSHDLSLHSSEGLNGAALYRLRMWTGESTQVSAYSLLQMDAITGWKLSGAQGVSFSRRNETLRLEAELFIGEDYVETDFNAQRGPPRDVYFGAATIGVGYRLGSIEPFARASTLIEDLEFASNKTLEGVLGTRYYVLEDFQVGGELNLLRSTILSSQSQVIFVARYFF